MILKNIYQNFNKILPIMIQIYLTILGLSWVFIFVYLRIFTKPLSYDLATLKKTITINYIISFSIFILIHLIIFSSICIVLKKKIKKQIEF